MRRLVLGACSVLLLLFVVNVQSAQAWHRGWGGGWGGGYYGGWSGGCRGWGPGYGVGYRSYGYPGWGYGGWGGRGVTVSVGYPGYYGGGWGGYRGYAPYSYSYGYMGARPYVYQPYAYTVGYSAGYSPYGYGWGNLNGISAWSSGGSPYASWTYNPVGYSGYYSSYPYASYPAVNVSPIVRTSYYGVQPAVSTGFVGYPRYSNSYYSYGGSSFGCCGW